LLRSFRRQREVVSEPSKKKESFLDSEYSIHRS
jgi:hypothetical protein